MDLVEPRITSYNVCYTKLLRSLQRISQLTTDFPQIQELDINPLIVGEIGNDPVVADARMTFARPLVQP